MLFLILSILCSVTVGIIFKYIRRFDVSVMQIVAWNYVFALFLCYISFKPDITAVGTDAPWLIYIPLMFLLPTIFLMLAASIRYMGIVKTDAAQRLSLFIPILAAYFIFREDFNFLKFLGIIIGFPAIWLIFSRKSDSNGEKWIYPAIVLVGFGIVDVLFKQIALHTTLPYTTSLFVIFWGALAIGAVYALYEIIARKQKVKWLNLLFGGLTGMFNFGNILFYLQAHKAFSENPSTVFAIMNIGVIVVGSIAGIYIFKEKLTNLNYAGLLMAISAIIFITLSQVYT